MSKEIINRVENSKLISIDLGDYYLPGKKYELDIKEKNVPQVNPHVIGYFIFEI